MLVVRKVSLCLSESFRKWVSRPVYTSERKLESSDKMWNGLEHDPQKIEEQVNPLHVVHSISEPIELARKMRLIGTYTEKRASAYTLETLEAKRNLGKEPLLSFPFRKRNIGAPVDTVKYFIVPSRSTFYPSSFFYFRSRKRAFGDCCKRRLKNSSESCVISKCAQAALG